MPDHLWQWGIVSIVLGWDLMVVWTISRYTRPSWKRKPKVAKTVKRRITYDRAPDGGIIDP
jgi:hypothetical protein